ncbi:LemA family protein [Clostridium sp. CM028]|uniref:LemA family protein n=1 Tax=unclassified Clostridium TaxID=2614128 RepID=UPI001C0DE4B5|nr:MULTISPECIES: LemA family protein [unclassified Clostridium]MBU3093952.1 LemA family protein [Clostridium sp. CF011]MBW9147350.1 LemA family protein [Clostridium sp. CM027]MBW9150184.1 LemA family protein [Clostridium sp. CM028]UVE39729.1 LemA family protein [Clostridium sp. CM027]WAG68636.1 LemA family protein [Clostridium sp. CF011]
MNKTLRTIAIVAAIFLVITMPIIGGYNKIVSLEQKVKVTEGNIDTQLQRRSDLIPNLVETVKGYASQEKDIFIKIADARAKLAGAKTVPDKAQADSELGSAVSRLLVVVENYPDLKSSQNFRDLTVALEGTENRIGTARQDYNTNVSSYNSTIKKFPTNIIAGIFRFDEKAYYKASESAKVVPKVDFTK